jgi:hypothetical protein
MANAPFGDIFQVQTPALDRFSQQQYAEHQRREQQREKDLRDLDEEFSKNISGIWDADIPELTKKYSDYKQAFKNIQLKRKGGSPEDQMELMKKKADLFQFIGNSKGVKDIWQQQVKNSANDPKRLYDEQTKRKLIEVKQIPSPKISSGFWDDLMYKFSVPDLSKEKKAAWTPVGGLIKKESSPIQSSTDKYRDEVEVYKIGNTPNTAQNNLINQITTSNKGDGYTRYFNALDDNFVQDIKNKYYSKINDPAYIKAYGTLPPLREDTDLAKAAAIDVMMDVVNSQIPTPEKKITLNKERLFRDNEELWQLHEKIRQGNRKEIASIQNQFRLLSPQYQDYMIDSMWGDYVGQANKNNGYFTPNPLIAEELGFTARGVPIPAENFKMDADGNTVIYTDPQSGTRKTMTVADFYAVARRKFTQKSASDGTPAIKYKPTSEYTQVTETDKGTIGVKNGKWYYIKTGKPVE